jgi:hypothetical protein
MTEGELSFAPQGKVLLTLTPEMVDLLVKAFAASAEVEHQVRLTYLLGSGGPDAGWAWFSEERAWTAVKLVARAQMRQAAGEGKG